MTSSKQATEGPSGSLGGAAPSPAPSTTVGIDHKAILADVRANLAKLDACPRHDFVGVKETAIGPSKDGGWVYRDYVCASCGGKVDSHAERWYRRGTSDGFKAGELNALTSLERFLRESVIRENERLKELETDLECINFAIWSSEYADCDEIHEKVDRSARYRESLRSQADTVRLLVDAISRLDALKGEPEHVKGGGK